MSTVIGEDYILDARIHSVNLEAQIVYTRILALSVNGHIYPRSIAHLQKMLVSDDIKNFRECIDELCDADLIHVSDNEDNNYVSAKLPMHSITDRYLLACTEPKSK